MAHWPLSIYAYSWIDLMRVTLNIIICTLPTFPCQTCQQWLGVLFLFSCFFTIWRPKIYVSPESINVEIFTRVFCLHPRNFFLFLFYFYTRLTFITSFTSNQLLKIRLFLVNLLPVLLSSISSKSGSVMFL